MYYAAGSNSSEVDLLNDVDEMKRGMPSTDLNLVLLIDRIEGHSEDSTVLDGNFSDSRLYEIQHGSFERIHGKEFFPGITESSSEELNMGDASTLSKLIQYCKTYYPADHYMLILRSHGNGISMCADGEHGKRDKLYPAEISNTLGASESVDVLGLDVCSMAGLENLYQWRPGSGTFSADVVIASAPLSGAWAYDAILERVNNEPKTGGETEPDFFKGGTEENIDPRTMTPLEFAQIIMEETYDSQRWASWGMFDNTKIAQVKNNIDRAAKALAKEDPTAVVEIIKRTLGYSHTGGDDQEVAQLTMPYVDAYHFWRLINTDERLSEATKTKANAVMRSIDELVVHSYYGSGFLPPTSDFENGKSGVYQIIPQGDRIFSQSGSSFWSHCGWFHPDDRSSEESSYGQYDWCSDGATPANQQVENFFELLDHLFDSSNNASGGVNGYQW